MSYSEKMSRSENVKVGNLDVKLGKKMSYSEKDVILGKTVANLNKGYTFCRTLVNIFLVLLSFVSELVENIRESNK